MQPFPNNLCTIHYFSVFLSGFPKSSHIQRKHSCSPQCLIMFEAFSLIIFIFVFEPSGLAMCFKTRLTTTTEVSPDVTKA